MEAMMIPVAFVTAGGAALGLILALVAKFMYVPVDELAGEIREALPGANCGACGYAGCNEYAERLADRSELAANLCTPGGGQVAVAVSALLGVAAGEVVAKTAVLHCGGSCDHTAVFMDYGGPPTCVACSSFYRGKGDCSYGCIGFGDCVAVCIYDAIYLNNGIPTIDKAMCTGCGMCATVCPHLLITVEPTASEVHVACSSKNTGGITRKLCTVGCIGCMRCVKECEFDAIKVEEFLAVIDTDKCTNCGKCVAICPTKSILVHPVAVPVS